MPQNIGRPSKYIPKHCEAIVDFFSVEPWIEVEVSHTNKKGDEWTSYERRPNKLPTFNQFAASIGVNEDTVVEWTKKHEDFSAAYKRAKELQKWFLIENGLNNLYNASFAIFTAKNITDMRDKTEIDHTSDGKQITGFNYVTPHDTDNSANEETTSGVGDPAG